MALFKIEAQNIANDAIAVAQIDDTAYASLTSSANTAYALAVSVSDVANNIPRVSGVQIANSSYVILDDTAANTSGGYVVISGSGFVSGCQVIVGDTLATSVSFVSSGTLHCQVPAKSAGTYNIFITNPNGSTAIGVNALTYSGTPTWITASTLTDQRNATSFNVSFSATLASSYSVANNSSLPAGTSLLANGYFYGTITVETQTTYNFDIVATDDENQDSTRSFSLTVKTINSPPTVNYLVVGGGGAGYIAPSPGGYGGGGGAGGLLYGNTSITPATSYTVTIGAGSSPGSQGGDSSFGPAIVSKGGGYAGRPGGNGGSGGGTDASYTQGRGVYPGSPYISGDRQGYDGAKSNGSPQYSAGGGGGAGGAGRGEGSSGPGTTNAFVYYDTAPFGLCGGPGKTDAELDGMLLATNSGALAGAPGNPSYNNITYIAGGGSGGGSPYNYVGGFGGGGWGRSSPAYGTATGFVNTGGGGGGGSYGSPSVPNGPGGSGIVIVRYSNAYDNAASTTGSPTFYDTGGYKYYKFTGSGSISWD